MPAADRVGRRAVSAEFDGPPVATAAAKPAGVFPDARMISDELCWNADRAAEICFSDADECSAVLVLKTEGMVAGLDAVGELFRLAGPSRYRPIATDGVWLSDVPQQIAAVTGSTRGILAARRSVLNLIGHLSGIATMTARFVAAIGARTPRVVGTRKMTLGLAPLETYAVELAGGLAAPAFDPQVVWLKKTHHDLMGGVGPALERLGPIEHPRELHVECQTLGDVECAFRFRVDRLVLDNMTPRQLTAAVDLVDAICGRNGVALEATGNITLPLVQDIVQTGVDYISVGALTKSSPALDVSFEVIGDVGQR